MAIHLDDGPEGPGLYEVAATVTCAKCGVVRVPEDGSRVSCACGAITAEIISDGRGEPRLVAYQNSERRFDQPAFSRVSNS